MGGEHHVSFHNYDRYPCNYIHKKHKDIPETEADKAKWSDVKTRILRFMNEYSFDRIIKLHIILIEKWESPSDINLFWHRRDDETEYVGKVLHDVTKILTLEYPGKICSCFDRCNIYEEFPGQDWNMCTFKYGIYHKIPEFQLYEGSDYETLNPKYHKEEVQRLKQKIKQLKQKIAKLEGQA